jgi:AcrR family transcriptional regulator
MSMATRERALSARAVQAEQTRQQILDTAQRLFAELGYDATSLQMIADELGITKAAVYYHFPAKADILHEALLPGIQRVEILIQEAEAIRNRRGRMEHLVSGLADFLVESRQYVLMASAEPAAKRHKMNAQSEAARERALTLLYGDNPSAAERLAFSVAVSVPDHLDLMVDLTDDELRDVLTATMLRILRVPSASRD